MTTKTQLQNKIQKLEAELVEFKSQLSSYEELTIETASVGDTLEDGSIVLQKSNRLALLVAPKDTEVYCSWTRGFAKVFQELVEQGFNSSQWFVPTKEELELAYGTIPKGFSTACYWSSTEFCAARAYYVGYNAGIAFSLNKGCSLCVRAFRRVAY